MTDHDPLTDFATAVGEDHDRVADAAATVERMQALEKTQTEEIQQVAALLLQQQNPEETQ